MDIMDVNAILTMGKQSPPCCHCRAPNPTLFEGTVDGEFLAFCHEVCSRAHAAQVTRPGRDEDPDDEDDGGGPDDFFDELPD